MPTIITAENMPAVLAQIVERQEQQTAQIEALTAICAEQALQLEEQQEQSRVQASALRATTANLARGVSNAVKGVSAKGNGNFRIEGYLHRRRPAMTNLGHDDQLGISEAWE
jgi:hypothetical protein